jgi:transposase
MSSMFIRTKPVANSSRKRVQICASYRTGDKVKQKVIRHVGIADNDSHLDELRKLAEVLLQKLKKEQEGPTLFDLDELTREEPIAVTKKPVLSEPKQTASLVAIESMTEEKRVVDGFHEIFGTLFNQLGFNSILTGKYKDILRDVVLARIAHPASKAATQQILTADFGRDIELDRIYRMMDALLEQKETALKTVFMATEQCCFGKIDLMLFDVTTLYFESTDEDDLRQFGYSKDQKFHTTQVVLALATTSSGLPVGYRLFPGNTADVSTLVTAIEQWKQTIPIGEVRIVADRAMMTEKNLQFLEQQNIQYIIAAKLKKQAPHIREQILNANRDKTGVVFDQPVGQRRLVGTFCTDRCKKDRSDRERILQKIDKKIGKGKNAKKLVSNAGYQKYLSCTGESKLFVDPEKIAQDAAWDGLHGIITNSTDSAEELLAQYRRLWVIEESFRLHKHNLSLRPIYHFKPERIEAHILICYLAFALIRHLEFRVALQREKISINEMRWALWRVQSSYLAEEGTENRYRLPSAMSVTARKLYQVMGIKRTQTAQRM